MGPVDANRGGHTPEDAALNADEWAGDPALRLKLVLSPWIYRKRDSKVSTAA